MKDLKEHEKLLQEAYILVKEQGSPRASKIMNMAQNEANKVYRKKSQACKEHLGLIKAFKTKDRLKFMACNGRAKAAAARRAASVVDKNIGKCEKEKHCRETLKLYAKRLRDFAAHEEALSAGDEAKLQAKGVAARKK